MGRQMAFHLLEKDCEQLLHFVRDRDPVIILERDTSSAELVDIGRPCAEAGIYTLWNQPLAPDLVRKFVEHHPKIGPRYTIDGSLPVIEFFYRGPAQEWEGRPALLQGRLWTGFGSEDKHFRSWYQAVTRWIRKNFIRNPVSFGYVGPCAYEWFKEGGSFLPEFGPPATEVWLSWMAAQNKHRALLAR